MTDRGKLLAEIARWDAKANEPENPEHSKYGARIGQSRWFEGKPALYREPGTRESGDYVRWRCPICGGEMVSNGWTWPTDPPGFHHECDTCGFTAALEDAEYPLNL